MVHSKFDQNIESGYEQYTDRAKHTKLYESVYFSSSSWKTIDGGLSRLPKSFAPHVEKDLQLNRKIERVSFSEENKEVTLQWKGAGGELQSASYDYAVMAVPFVVMANWRLPSTSATTTYSIWLFFFFFFF